MASLLGTPSNIFPATCSTPTKQTNKCSIKNEITCVNGSGLGKILLECDSKILNLEY